jgi:RNA polymerase-binding transcription factor DksA
MNASKQSEIERLAAAMDERKLGLQEEIRQGLARTGNERYSDLLSGTADAGDESVANLLRDITHAEVARDVGELRDIVAAERRIAAGVYGTCIDCGAPVDYKRLEAYPTAKRCLSCQQTYERTRGSRAPSRL